MIQTAHLLTNQTANGSGTPLVTWTGGAATFCLTGTVDTCTVTIYVDIGNGNNTNTDLTMTETGIYLVYGIPAGATVTATVSSVGASTDVSLIMADS